MFRLGADLKVYLHRGCATSSPNCLNATRTRISTICCPSTSPKPPQPDPTRPSESDPLLQGPSTCGENSAYVASLFDRLKSSACRAFRFAGG